MLATDVREISHNGNSVTGADASLVVHTDSRTETDEVLKALGELDAVLKENAERERVLFQRIADVRLARENGQDWKAILADEDEPSTVQLVSTILRRQSEASGYLRRSLVVALSRVTYRAAWPRVRPSAPAPRWLPT
jgi:hypothetical protein